MISKLRVVDMGERLRRGGRGAKTARRALQGFEISRSGLLVIWAYLGLLRAVWSRLALFALMRAYLALLGGSGASFSHDDANRSGAWVASGA